MKIIALLFLLLAASVRADPIFGGYLTTRESGTLFVVTSSPGASPRWVKLGETVDGYRVTKFEQKSEVLVLKKDGRELRLKLAESKVRDGGHSIDPAFIETAKKMVARMDKWDSDVSYQAALAADGNWHVFATKIVDGKRVVRLVRMTPKGVATNYSWLDSQEPNKAPEPTPGPVTPRALERDSK